MVIADGIFHPPTYSTKHDQALAIYIRGKGLVT